MPSDGEVLSLLEEKSPGNAFPYSSNLTFLEDLNIKSIYTRAHNFSLCFCYNNCNV